MTSYGYIRQSKRADLDVALSAETQAKAIKRLAERYGDDPNKVIILSDMGRSGSKEKAHLRASYQLLLRAIKENGHGTTIYALSMSRLARSLNELLNIFTLASDHGVRIVFEKEGEVRFDTPIGKLHATITSAVYEFERELAVERQRDNVAVRRARGERLGRKPYDNPEVVLQAYRESTSFNGTARLLNSNGVPSWSGKPWRATAVKSVLRRIDPSLVVKTGKGRKARTDTFPLYQLLRCHCGAILTGSRELRKEKIYHQYRCHNADFVPNHTNPRTISEGKILPLIQEEVGDLTNLVFATETPIDQERLSALTTKRTRVVEAFLDGVINKSERDARIEALDAEIASMQTKEKLLHVPQWDDEPGTVNQFLRSLFGTVQLNEQMEPTFDWKIKVRPLRKRIPRPSVVRLDKKS